MIESYRAVVFGKRNWSRPVDLILIAWLALLSISWHCFSPAVSAHAAVQAPKYVTIPVYYITDRNLENDGFGNRRRYESDCLHQMYYGTAFVTIENHKRESLGSNHCKTLGWTLGEDHPKGKHHNDQIDPSSTTAAKHSFLSRLKDALDTAGTDQLCVYVHGADEGFEDACLDAAEFAYALHRPLVLYSWPSEPKLLDYVVDNGNSEWSQEHFNMFCRDLLSFKEAHPLHLIMLAHSMGNRFLFRAMDFLYHSQLVSDCEFVSPDMDIDICRHYLMGFKKVDYNTSMRLYVSNRDKMLKLSQRLFGGYARLGEDVRSDLVPDRSAEQLIVQKDTIHKNEKFKHEDAQMIEPADNAKNAQNVQNTQNAQNIPEPQPADVLERIDFTALDKGLTGHSIPFQLIADLVDGKKSGEGFELVEDKEDKSKHPLKVVKPANIQSNNEQFNK